MKKIKYVSKLLSKPRCQEKLAERNSASQRWGGRYMWCSARHTQPRLPFLHIEFS
jgi:hypothetical protein